MAFVQADPIRAPARAQDLILRQRVKNYRAGDVERRYDSLDIEEDVFINYGFVSRALYESMHPRAEEQTRNRGEQERSELLLNFVRERGTVHPQEADEHFAHGSVTNNWGGSSNATTQLLEALHYRGLLRVARREKGIRVYALHQRETLEPRAQLDQLVDVLVNLYAPLPGASLAYYVRRLRYAAPQWRTELSCALQRAKERIAHAQVEGLEWFWPAEEEVISQEAAENVRLLAPFDPLVHDRGRFELFWGWGYRFEAYTPVAKRKLGYYALPLLWREHVIGWANLSVRNNELTAELGYLKRPPRERSFKRELEAELERMRVFLLGTTKR